jgi:hypothetical protein
MGNVLKKHLITEISEDARRQYIDAKAVFKAWEAARDAASQVRGGMFWKKQGGKNYLIRTSTNNSQKSLGPSSAETISIYDNFTARKKETEQRLSDLTEELRRHQKMNRALDVGRTPRLLVDTLARLTKAEVNKHFTVIGTHALYAYEAETGTRIGEAAAMTTRDIDLLWDTRKRIKFAAHMKILGSSMLELLKKVDSTFELIDGQNYTAVNKKGFEIDIIRREAKNLDPHPLRLTNAEEEFSAVQAKNAELLLSAKRFSSIVVSTSGHMARMETVSPLVFAKFKRWMAAQPDRNRLKRKRDILQAEVVEELVDEYLPHLKVV